jgi:DNA-binding LacI/PurR family transcriptional regulator
VVADRHLVSLVKKCGEAGLVLGQDVGLISFNDTVLKEVVAGGITTISTDFRELGRLLARMVETRTYRQIRNASGLILRNTL